MAVKKPKGVTHGTFNKNPGNIKGYHKGGSKTDFTKWLDKQGIKYSQGSEASDGGYFIHFETNEDGLKAADNFWNVTKTWSAYENKDGSSMTVEDALSKYSNSGYDQTFLDSLTAKGIDLTASLDTLDDDDLAMLSHTQMQTEDPNQYAALQTQGLISKSGVSTYRGKVASAQSTAPGPLVSAPSTNANVPTQGQALINAQQGRANNLKLAGSTAPAPDSDLAVNEDILALIKGLSTATNQTAGERSYTSTEEDLTLVDDVEQNLRTYYIDKFGDQSLDDDDLMNGKGDFSDEESIFSKIADQLSEGLDLQTQKGQAILKARLVSFDDKVSSPEYIEKLRASYKGPSFRNPLESDMAFTNVMQDTNFLQRLKGNVLRNVEEKNNIVIESRDISAGGNARHEGDTVENGELLKIPGTNQDAKTTAAIIAKKLAAEGNSYIADLLMQDGGSDLAAQYILDEVSRQSLNQDSQGTEFNLEVFNANLQERILKPEEFVERTGQEDPNANTAVLLNSSFDDDGIAKLKPIGLKEIPNEQEAPELIDTRPQMKADLEAAELKLAQDEAAANAKVDSDKKYKRMHRAEMALSGLKAAAGIISLSQALKDPEVDVPEISPLIMEAVDKQRQLAKSGMTAAEKGAAMSNLDNAYAGAMKNVLRASGGQRGLYLANQGTVDANRIQGLNQLAAQDAALHRQNLGQYNQLAASVGQMKLNRDMSVEQMKQTTMNQNKQLMGGIGSNLVSDALSDVSWYMNPNRDLIEEAKRTSLKNLLGKNDDDYDPNADFDIGQGNSRGAGSDELKQLKAENARLKALNK